MDLKELFKDAPPEAKKLGVVGHPLEHSLSPAMQAAAIEALGVNAVYRKIDVAPEAWADFARQARELPLDGFNITVPHKERLLKEWGGDENVIQGEEAALSGAVNTVDREDGTWGLYNTDGYGFADDLEAEGIDISGKNMVVLGAGGAARAILSVFGRLEPARLTLVNRTAEKAKKLAAEFRKKLDLGEDRLSAASAEEAKRSVAEASLLVNATSAGLSPGGPPMDAGWLHANLILYDLIYHRETELMRAAKAAGADAYGGLGMLARQGAKSFEIWFGRKAPVDAMRQAAEEELKKK